VVPVQHLFSRAERKRANLHIYSTLRMKIFKKYKDNSSPVTEGQEQGGGGEGIYDIKSSWA
jgi:hypothetical protein